MLLSARAIFGCVILLSIKLFGLAREKLVGSVPQFYFWTYDFGLIRWSYVLPNSNFLKFDGKKAKDGKFLIILGEAYSLFHATSQHQGPFNLFR